MSGFFDWITNLGQDHKWDFDRERFVAKTTRDERACYHAKRRADCWYYQRGSCTCNEEAK